MSNKENEYKELFISEASSSVEELNNLMTRLEKSPAEVKTIDNIFRITHTLKGNAAGMGFEKISKFAHALEDVFTEIKKGSLLLDSEIFTVLFKSIDILTELIDSINSTDANVKYRGIQKKLEVLVENLRKKESAASQTLKTTYTRKSSTTKKTKVAGENPSELQETIDKKNKTDLKDTGNAITEVQDVAEVVVTEETDTKKITFSDVVQVPVKKLDNLLNLVGELIIERDRLITQHENNVSRNEFNRLKRVTSDLQYSVMDVRLVQVGFLFNKFHRVVRDAATSEGKKVDLIIEGSDTEIDRNILQIISDSLIHLIRNAIGHGIEDSKVRQSAKKSESGTLTLSARNESEGVVIDIKDDGKGIDIARIREKVIQKGWVDANAAKNMSEDEIISFIFEPGFSTNEVVNSISGRGVGMDVVKKAADSVGGNIKVTTEAGKGTTFTLILPSSMAVKATLLFEVGHTQYAIPLAYTDAVISVHKSKILKMQNRLMVSHLDKTIETLFLKELFFKGEENVREKAIQSDEKWQIIIIHYNGKKLGLIVDKLLQQKEIVEKPLKKPVDFVKFISGVTILGNGNVCLVLNVPQIIQKLFNYSLNVNATAVA
ncbi:chemotaxis protein CheA [Marivirga lumbricoides]|uniref:Chemotaxis protein CheA n=1 Tax=Marivirga lumbricoides TaxID=1046115 RepID=A0ABQ1LPV7_9BACT|nr:chemotaxis protein CheA [Marivirga lumbricoides]